MEFRILGPLQVVGDSGPVVLGGRRQRTVLAVLLAHWRRTVSAGFLADAVWDDRPPATARRQIQNDMAAIRRLLATAGAGSRDVIRSDSAGYRIASDAGQLDARLFDDQVAQARQLAAGGRVPEAVAMARSALALWRGPALMGLAGRCVEATAAALAERRLTATEECVAWELELGRHDHLIGELAESVADDPLRERLVGQLMLALYRAGRQNDALAAYQRLRTRLADELGLDPGRSVRDLHAAILRGDPALDPPADAARAEVPAPVPGPVTAPVPGPVTAPVPGPVTVPRQLPPAVTGFTGRLDPLRRLDQFLASGTGICVIAGMAGVGKTALAVHWAHRVADRFPDGQLYLDLQGYGGDAPVRPVEALAHLLRSLGEPAERIPLDPQTAAGRYRSLLAGHRVLVVLDNAASADQVRPLLPTGPGSFTLVTSRERLTDLTVRDGAQGVPLDVLSADEAYALLGVLMGADRVAAEPQAAEALATACSHLPLALRVTGANFTAHRWHSIAAHAAALADGDRLAALDVDGDETTGVRRAFDLSYRALPPTTRRVFRLLGCVPGPDVTVGAAAAMLGAPAVEAARHLSRLWAAHLLTQPAPGRYAFHDLLRQHAAALSRDEDRPAEVRAAQHRLYDWYLRRADAAAKILYPHALRLELPPVPPPADGTVDGAVPAAGPESALAWLDAEHRNLVTVVGHAAGEGPHPTAWLLADTLRSYFWLRMRTVDWDRCARTALVAAQVDGDVRAQAAAQLSLADLHMRRCHLRQAVTGYTAALALAEQAGWQRCRAAALGNLGVLHCDSGQPRTAADYLGRALRSCRTSGSHYGEALVLATLGRVHWQLGRLAEAARYCAEAVAINRRIGSSLGEAAALMDLGEVYRTQGRLGDAAELFGEALERFRRLGDRTNEAATTRGLAAVYCDQGDLAQAAALAGHALTAAGELADRRLEADTRNTLGAVADRQGRHREALTQYTRAHRLAGGIGNRYAQVEAVIGVARAYRGLGLPERAAGQARQALAMARQAGYGLLDGSALAVLGQVPVERTPLTAMTGDQNRIKVISHETGRHG